MTGRSLATLFVYLSLAAQSPAPPQAAGLAKPPAQGDQPFRSQVTEVIVPITVVDEKSGKFVSNLDAKDFKVFDEGRNRTSSSSLASAASRSSSAS